MIKQCRSDNSGHTNCIFMIRFQLKLLLLGFVNYSGTVPVSVSGEKRGRITLTCESEAREISDISLSSRSEIIPVCPTEDCSGRVYKQGNCDVVFKNLSFSDAGTYFMRVYYSNDQTELERQIRTYQLHIQDEVSVKTGEELKLDVLLSIADKVQHQSRRSTEWMKVWSRTDGVQSERITIRDRNLIINEFTARDAGSYRVLGSEEEPLITVTVTESKEIQDDTDGTKHRSYWIGLTPITVLVVLLVLIRIAVTSHKRLHIPYLPGVTQ
ncbi:hypothetical protein G5714_019192 [Onychostoma macrolepis]|uniref:Immunoglobulin domain-containing protein n=1 Tax=Onychostoma macrolepis TaxID=369639 RepID=A0A7J6C191_9TELE|nr:hypothetical protein G5714_019192 [Onychostoma macrolepis]